MSTSSKSYTPGRLPVLLAALVLAGSIPLVLEAQETESALSPAGRLRIEFAPTFTSWSERFGLRSEDGALVEEREDVAFDLARDDALRLFPGTDRLTDAVEELLEADFEPLLGDTRATATQDRIRIPLRLDLGVFDWLTIGGTVPLVKNRTELEVDYRAAEGVNLGANPAFGSPGTVLAYVGELDRVLGELGDGGGGSGLRGDLQAFRDALIRAYSASPLFPAVGTAAGDALLARSAALNQRVQASGIEGFGSELPLAANALTDMAAFETLVENTLDLVPLRNTGTQWQMGDVEVHAIVRLLEGVRRDSAGGPATARWEVGAGALVRLGTGSMDLPNAVLDLRTGDGQTDYEGRVFANLLLGDLGLWTDVRYGVQGARTIRRRIGPPDLLLLPPALTGLEWTPGDYLQVEVAPRYQLTGELALVAGYRLWRKAEDVWRTVQPAPNDPASPLPGTAFVDASLLALESEETAHHVGGGLVFNTLDAWREGRTGLPFEARFTVQHAVAGSGGMTPVATQVRFTLRLYQHFWGD